MWLLKWNTVFYTADIEIESVIKIKAVQSIVFTNAYGFFFNYIQMHKFLNKYVKYSESIYLQNSNYSSQNQAKILLINRKNIFSHYRKRFRK